MLGCGITFVSKFAMAYVAGSLKGVLEKRIERQVSFAHAPFMYIIAALSALSYVALYMLKTFIFGFAVDGLNLAGVYAKMLAKLPASLINAATATVLAPILYAALWTPLKYAGITAKLR